MMTAHLSENQILAEIRPLGLLAEKQCLKLLMA